MKQAELIALAERCERDGVRATSNALVGFDGMRVGEVSRRGMIDDAANLFTCAAALRALAAMEPTDDQG